MFYMGVILDLWKSGQDSTRELPYTLHPTSPSANFTHNPGTFVNA